MNHRKVVALYILLLLGVFGCTSPQGDISSQVVITPGSSSKPAVAREQSDPGESAVKEWFQHLLPEHWDLDSIEDWGNYWTGEVDDRVQYIDSFFGDDRLKDENKGTRIGLGLGVKYDTDEGFSLKSDFNLRLAFPHLEHRFQLIIDNTFEVTDVESSGDVENELRDPSPTAALRYVFGESEKWRTQIDGGIDFGNPIQLFVKPRASVTFPWEKWEVRLAETLKLATEDGFSETSSMTWSRQMPSKSLLKLTSQLDWEEQTGLTTPSQAIQYYRSTSVKTAHRLLGKGVWPMNAEELEDNEDKYIAEYAYRRLIYKNWLFLELTPGVDFSEERDYEANPYITIVFDMLFQSAPTVK